MDSTTTLDDEAVARYLRDHPAFFRERLALLGELELPHESGTAVSLIERQVIMLRERNMNLHRRLNDLLQAARDNDALFAKTRSLTLAMLDVVDWAELNEVLATNLLVDFEADYACCHLQAQDVRLDTIVGYGGGLPTDPFLPAGVACCMALRAEELSVLFPGRATDGPGSVVLIPFTSHSGRGCLVVGSRELARFSPDMDTLFVRYIGDVLARIVSRLS
ncbi:MAG: DUF484 family protein [Pseudomonadales bacterium]|nr:DUF484 family protein [Pseudomonadales bacterium]MCP5184106.1 DUF484 family protein [Pseudomonadales bacterium]